MKHETSIGWGILLVALIVGIICFYLGKGAASPGAYKQGYDDGYAQALEDYDIED